MRGRRRRRRRRRGRRRNSNRFRVLSFPSQKNITILQILFKLPSMRPTVAFLIKTSPLNSKEQLIVFEYLVMYSFDLPLIIPLSFVFVRCRLLFSRHCDVKGRALGNCWALLILGGVLLTTPQISEHRTRGQPTNTRGISCHTKGQLTHSSVELTRARGRAHRQRSGLDIAPAAST